MASYIFDIVIVALLAISAWRGAVKGLVMSLCGLAMVFAAFFAAQFISNMFCPPVANIIRPIIIQTVRGADAEPETDPEDPEAGYTADELLRSIQKEGLFEGFDHFLEQGVTDNNVGRGIKSPMDALAGYLAMGIAKALLFGIVFLGIQIAWFLISHTLDLAFKLPILAELNLAGGLIVGLVKGALLIIVLVWLGRLAGVVPGEPDTPILSLFTVEGLAKLLESLPG